RRGQTSSVLLGVPCLEVGKRREALEPAQRSWPTLQVRFPASALRAAAELDERPLARSVHLLESRARMIYCVVPEELAPELYDRLADYYKDDPNVKVIIDRRKSERRNRTAAEAEEQQRETRDRRRPRIPGEF